MIFKIGIAWDLTDKKICSCINISNLCDFSKPFFTILKLSCYFFRCAGEIAAVANENCAVGVAFGAKVSGIRILDGPMTDSLEAMAFNTKSEVNDVYSCSWGPDDNGRTVDGPHQLAQVCKFVTNSKYTDKKIFVLESPWIGWVKVFSKKLSNSLL